PSPFGSASPGISPELQILIDPLSPEHKRISQNTKNPDILHLFNNLSTFYEMLLKLHKPNDIWMGNIRVL
ncbi:MAG: hypothetical protein ACWGOW_10325, partial [Gammaproteobacteria bacterium]